MHLNGFNIPNQLDILDIWLVTSAPGESLRKLKAGATVVFRTQRSLFVPPPPWILSLEEPSPTLGYPPLQNLHPPQSGLALMLCTLWHHQEPGQPLTHSGPLPHPRNPANASNSISPPPTSLCPSHPCCCWVPAGSPTGKPQLGQRPFDSSRSLPLHNSGLIPDPLAALCSRFPSQLEAHSVVTYPWALVNNEHPWAPFCISRHYFQRTILQKLF